MNSKQYLILDCFVDEPACFGVPPFVSPYPRYIYGALIDAGCENSSISYKTIENLKETEYLLESQYEMVFLIGGAVVPGRYLGSKIGSLAEIEKILKLNNGQKFAIGGLISDVLKNENTNIFLVKNDIEKFAYEYCNENIIDSRR